MWMPSALGPTLQPFSSGALSAEENSYLRIHQADGGFRAHILLEIGYRCPIKPQDCIMIICKPQETEKGG